MFPSQETHKSINLGNFRIHVLQFAGKRKKGEGGPMVIPKIVRSPINLGWLCFQIQVYTLTLISKTNHATNPCDNYRFEHEVDFGFTSLHFLGEDPVGEWIVNVSMLPNTDSDQQDENSFVNNELRNWRLTFHGSSLPNEEVEKRIA